MTHAVRCFLVLLLSFAFLACDPGNDPLYDNQNLGEKTNNTPVGTIPTPADPNPTTPEKPSEITMPTGESMTSNDDYVAPENDPTNNPQSDTPDEPGTDDPAGTIGDDIDTIPNDGWLDPSEPEVWAVNPGLDPYPNTLPELPVAMDNPTYQPWTSGRQLVVHEDQIFVASIEANSVVVLDRSSGKVQRIIAVGSRPEQIVVAPDGTAFATIRHGESVVKIASNATQISNLVKVGVEPYGLALSPDATTLYVTISGEDKLVALDADTLTPIGSFNTLERPRSVTVNPNGDVYISQQFGSVLMVETDSIGAPVTKTPLALRKGNPADFVVHADKHTTNVPTRVIGSTVHPETGAVYVTHVHAQPGSHAQSISDLLSTPPVTTTECEDKCTQSCHNKGGYGGGTVCNTSCVTNCVDKVLTFPHLIRPIEASVTGFAMGESEHMPVEACASVKDITTGEPMTALIDKPWDISHHLTHSLAFVVGQGTDNLLVLNTNSVDPMRSTVAEIKVGHAPTAVGFSADGQFAYVKNGQSFTVSEIDLTPLFSMDAINPGNAPNPGFGFSQFPSGATLTKPIKLAHQREVSYGVDPLAETEQLGRRIFTFARFNGLAANGFFSCATCHFEGTEDHLVWFVGDGPRQTPILAGRLAGTEPFNWIGSAPTLTKNFQNTVTRMGGNGLTDDQMFALEAFLYEDEHGLVPPPNPHAPKNGELSASAQEGKKLFYDPDVGCSKCHEGDTFQDGKTWDVGTFTELEVAIQDVKEEQDALKLNTPSLIDVYYSAPYFHDGSAATLFDVLNKTSESMGMTITLTGQQQIDMVNYLLTL